MQACKHFDREQHESLGRGLEKEIFWELKSSTSADVTLGQIYEAVKARAEPCICKSSDFNTKPKNFACTCTQNKPGELTTTLPSELIYT